ncbi:VIT1/CCC1 transporter family protein, partial [Candidatus Hakubella thermalkaliphila]
ESYREFPGKSRLWRECKTSNPGRSRRSRNRTSIYPYVDLCKFGRTVVDMSLLSKKLKELSEYDDIANISEIARRFFATNVFDGTLTILGTLVGSFLAGVKNPHIVIITGLSVAIAMAVSGVWGALLTERAERAREIDELERTTLYKLRLSKIGQAMSAAVVVVAIVNGASPFVVAVVAISPFFLLPNYMAIQFSYYASILVSFLMIFFIGIFLGRISRINIYYSGAKMTLAAIVIIVLSMLLKVAG